MLTLDEKQIRKGKPIGLPYQGSKKKISKKIVEIIKQNFGTEKVVYDVFGGGGAITAELLLNDMDVIYNDLDKTITDMFVKVINADKYYLNSLICGRDEFFEIRAKDNKTTTDELKLLVNSFGNNREHYLYSKQRAVIKYPLAKRILELEGTARNYRETSTYKQGISEYVDFPEFKQLDQLTRLNMLSDLHQIKQRKKMFKIYNESYEYFTDVKGAIFYLDPPYEGTYGYNKDDARKLSKEKYTELRNKLLEMPAGSEIVEDDIVAHLGTSTSNQNRMYYKDLRAKNSFDSKAFYEWAYQMSKNNIVLLSSYTVSDERFEEVYRFENAKSTYNDNFTGECEKLFMVKNTVN